MKNIKGRKLSRWKAIIVTDANTGEEKCFELNENERLINKITTDRKRKIHPPQKYVNIKITKNLLQKHQKLGIILNYMVSSSIKQKKKNTSSISQNNNGKSLITQQNASEKNIGNLYKDLADKYFYDSDDNDSIQENEINFSEFDFPNYL